MPLVRRVEVGCRYVAYSGEEHLIPDPTGATSSGAGHDFLADQVLEPRGYFAVDRRCRRTGQGGRGGDGDAGRIRGSAGGSDLTFAWSPAGRVSEPTSASPALTGGDDGTETLTLTATNDHGVADRATAEVDDDRTWSRHHTARARPRRARAVTLTATVTDPGRPTPTGPVDWGDGTSRPPWSNGRASATARGHHDYAEPGATRSCSREDDDGGRTTVTRPSTPAAHRRHRSDDALTARGAPTPSAGSAARTCSKVVAATTASTAAPGTTAWAAIVARPARGRSGARPGRRRHRPRPLRRRDPAFL